jgi:hypothetical protein
MSTDDHIISQFTSINRNLTSINKALQETNQTIGRVEGVQLSQWGAIKRLGAKLDSVTATTGEDLYGLKEVTGKLETKIGLLKSKKQSKFPPVTPLQIIRPVWKDIFTPGNVRLMLLILLLLVSIIALAVGITIPAKLLGG